MTPRPQLADTLNHCRLGADILQHFDHYEVRRQRQVRNIHQQFHREVDVDRLTARQSVEADFQRGARNDFQRGLARIGDPRFRLGRRRPVQQLECHDRHGGVVDGLARDKYVVLRCRRRWSISPAAVF